MPVTVRERRDGRARLELDGVTADVAIDGVDGATLAVVRPEWARLGGELPGRISTVAYRGAHTEYGLETPAGTVGLFEPGPPRAAPGDACTWRLERAWLVGEPGAAADAPFSDPSSPRPSPG